MSNPKLGQHRLDESNLIIWNFVGSLGPNQMLAEFYQPLRKIASASLSQRLSEYSVTTLEEAIAIARVAPEALSQVVGRDVVQKLSSDLLLEKLAQSNPSLSEYVPLESQSYSFGARTDIPEDAPVIDASATPPNRPLTATVNLVSNSCMPPIRDQGNRWTCVAFATCAVVEYERCHAVDTSPVRAGRDDLSEQFQYWDCKNFESQHGGSYSTQGTWPHISFPLAARNGICREDVWPYDMTNDPAQGDRHVLTAKNDAALRRVRRAIKVIDDRDITTLKKWLVAGHPLGIAIPVYRSWEESANTRMTGNITLPLPGETTTDGHALVLVGFEDNEDFAGGGFFIIRNSWGPQWGSRCSFGAGYGTLPYAYIEQYNMSAFTVEV